MAKTSKASGSTGAKKSSPPSEPPRVAGASSGGSGYAIGAAFFAVAIAVLFYMRCSGDDDPKPTPPPVTTATATATEAAPLPEFAPPPPPEEEEDAGVEDAGGATDVSGGSHKPVAGGAGACSNCGKGVSSAALNSAVSSTAGLARGCYQRALRTGGAEGSLMVSVSVGPTGNLCGARITSDSVGNPSISQCVLGKFQSRSYPKPQSGCVVVNVPISFKMKTP